MLTDLMNNPNIPYIIGAVMVFFAAIKLRKRSNDSKYSNDNANFDYVKISNPDGQKLYEQSIKKPLLLTAQEKLELSWKFLYEITDIVGNKFSPEDRKTVHMLGYKMLEFNARYEHVIDYGIRAADRTRNADKEAQKSEKLENDGQQQSI